MVPEAQTLPALLHDCAGAAPDQDALVVGDVRWTYGELAGQADAAASALASIGLRDGDTVALLAPNIAEWMPIAFGAMILGARVDAFNTWVKAYDLDFLLGSSGASVLITVDRVRSSDLLGEVRTLLPELDGDVRAGDWVSERFPLLRHVAVIGTAVPAGAHNWSQLMASVPAEPPAGPASEQLGDRPAFVLYTSGSTKNPKAVPLCHRDLIVNAFHIGERMGLTEHDRVWFGSPLFWSFGCANAMVATMSHRACLVVQPQFDPVAAAELMASEQVTAAYLLPAMVDALSRDAGKLMREVASLRTGVMIGRPEEVERAAVDLGIADICNVYGSTETYGNCCVTDHRWPLSRRMITQGEPLPGIEVRIVDNETNQVVSAGEPGEIQVRGRITPGYIGDDESNAEAFTADGWFRTGDRMVLNTDGTVAFVGRISDMIKTSGINVSPAEVESFLVTHPDIAEVLVLGAPHPTKDEVVVAFVVARSPGLTADAVIAYCKQSISGYKVPWAVSVVPALPRTGTGKLVRKDLRGAATELVRSSLRAGSPA